MRNARRRTVPCQKPKPAAGALSPWRRSPTPRSRALTIRPDPFRFFFFQAEDGIRDFHVTGVQTYALPICCRHVIAENRRVLAAAELLRTGDQAAIGALLTASHRSLRDEFEVSWPQADAAVEAATGAGAGGARLTGGGFGGSVVALVPAGRAGH